MKYILLLALLIAQIIPALATELGPEGNAEAARLFQNYKTGNLGCDASLPGKRVLLTGFGLFQGLSLNSAGSIVTNIADPKIWPTELTANEVVNLPANANLRDGKFVTQMGAVSMRRSLTINGQQFNLCILVLDVLWDTAGAIVSYEMDRFQPEKVLMLGGGGGPFLEGGALNKATKFQGYYPDGSADRNNVPLAPEILAGAPAELPMSWNNEKILADVQPLLNTAGLRLKAIPGARASNDYLCNHVSYVALATAQNRPLSLAGGLIRLAPQIRSHPKIGFFHLPWGLAKKKDVIENWGSLVTSILYFME